MYFGYWNICPNDLPWASAKVSKKANQRAEFIFFSIFIKVSVNTVRNTIKLKFMYNIQVESNFFLHNRIMVRKKWLINFQYLPVQCYWFSVYKKQSNRQQNSLQTILWKIGLSKAGFWLKSYFLQNCLSYHRVLYDCIFKWMMMTG